MIHKIKAFTATCDNCGKDYQNNYDGYSIFNDQNSLTEDMDNDSWHTEEDKHYCPICFTINDEDKLVINLECTKTLDWPLEVNYGTLVEPDKLYPVIYTVNQSGGKVFNPQFIKGGDLTEPQIKYLHKVGYFLEAQEVQGEKDGWIRVLSKNDLPVEDGDYWVANENGVFPFFGDKDKIFAKFKNKTLTHYYSKKVVPPSPPKAM